ncbi:DsbA family protein [Pseudoalteromonas sp. OOF1S-7]|uniref:DsbA family protein n=1 Tax=Pseudoalteromonas sp. OOF1S-7 TaxID=2917757 RepID=UPI001EF63C77|nr:DsbA family protein [Pseudoalteromonas sp. OOF1S-7]MCG7535002.1 DsbA family protein [Pseudoalteromonas sp. OOF1S-7]
MQFIYVMDPMCGWCYGFQPELELFLSNRLGAELSWVMGGLAPDTTEPMDPALRDTIASYWVQIERKTQVAFNHDFWQLNTPIRATYQACRAVIAAQSLQAHSAMEMVKAIQAAYYLQAKNPSLDKTLIACARSIGLDEIAFEATLKSAATETQFQQHLQIARQLQVSGYPALFYINDKDHAYPLALGFCHAGDLEQRLETICNDA